MRRRIAAIYGALAYLAFLLPIGYLAGFLADLGVPKTVDRGVGPLGPPLAVDLLLLALFGLQHSTMARPWFKRAVERWVPRELERSTYVLVSGLTLVLIYGLWRPVPAVLWDVAGTAVGTLAWTGFAAGLGLAVWATFALSHLHLFGISQVAAYVRGREHPRLELRRTLLYRIVRHPMTTGLLLVFWSTPRMTLGHLVFAAGMTVYSLVGTVFEERDLVRSFGDAYRTYRRQVPALLPVLRPRTLLPARGGLAVEIGLIVVGLGLAGVGALRAAATPGESSTEGGATVRLEVDSLTVDGRRRTFRLFDPDPGQTQPRPLVLALHGTGGDGARLEAFLGGALEAVARERGWLVAYPDALAGAWNDCRAIGGLPGRADRPDDLAYLRRLVDRLREEREVDPERVFVIGFSGGGHMAFRVALEAGRLTRGIAVFGASLPARNELRCRDRREPVPVLIVNGTRDPINPYGGGDAVTLKGRRLGRVRSTQATARYLRQRPGSSGTRVVTLDGGGHAVPGPASRFPRAIGRVIRSYDGVREAAAFFARQETRATIVAGE